MPFGVLQIVFHFDPITDAINKAWTKFNIAPVLFHSFFLGANKQIILQTYIQINGYVLCEYIFKIGYQMKCNVRFNIKKIKIKIEICLLYEDIKGVSSPYTAYHNVINNRQRNQCLFRFLLNNIFISEIINQRAVRAG